MKVLMIGLGSIGQRHLRNLLSLFSDVEVLAYRVRGLQNTFSNTMQILPNTNLDEKYNISVFNNIDEALSAKPDVAFITNITSMHIPCLKKVLGAGVDVFIEKPLSNSLESIGDVIRLRDEANCIAFMGFQNRFNPGLIELKKFVDNSTFGNIISVHVEMGERLTTMHTYENYAETYMAQKSMGGGVILNQMIHELDYIQWIFGKSKSVYAVLGNNSSLPIDVEDYCDAIYTCENNGNVFPIHVHSDFIQYPPKRICRVVFENATVQVDLIDNVLKIQSDVEECVRYDVVRNDLFIRELNMFFNCISSRSQNCFTIEEGFESLKMAICAKVSSEEKRIVYLSEVCL